MGVVKGAISIKDNMTVVLRSIRQEQSAFRQDVEKTKKELQATWDKKRTAKLEATAAFKAMDSLKKKMEPLRKKVVVATAVKDLATAKVKALGNQVKAVGKMVATPFVKLKNGTAAGFSKIAKDIKSIAKTVVIPVTVAATVGTTAILGGAISQGAQLEQSIGGVETLFKDSASVVKANADAAYRTAGLSANAYMEQVTSFSASLLSSLSGNTVKAAATADMAMVDMADNANKFGTSMESIQNAYQGFAKQNYTMLDNLKLGYGGTKEEMARLLQDAQKLTGVQYDINNLSDVYNAIHAIQKDLGVTGTTAKEASETFSGSFSSMKAAAQNVLGNLAIGGDVTGSMKELVESASTFLFNNAIPMIGSVLSALPGAVKTGIKTAAPKIKEAAGGIVKNLKDGMISALPSEVGEVVNSLFSSLGGLGNGFAAMKPQLEKFGTTVMGTVQKVAAAAMPAISSIITTVQSVIPSVLPVLETVVTTIGSVIAAAAPVIAGLVQGIGTVVSALAPVFQVIFDGIGQKVGSVLEFVGSKMGWIQNIIGTAAPTVAGILTTAWGVISPVMDLSISVFKLLFNVVQTVFNGIASVVSSVWSKVQPIVEGIGNGLSWVANKVKGLLGMSGGGDSGSVGSNAEGTNNWRGGPTWVGERGPELVDLPKGSRVLPNKESVQLAQNAARPVVREIFQTTTVEKPVVREVIQNTVEKPSAYTTAGNSSPVLERIEKGLGVVTGLLGRTLPNKESAQLAQNAARPVAREIFQITAVEKPSIYTTGDNSVPVLERIEKGLGAVAGLLGRTLPNKESDQLAQNTVQPMVREIVQDSTMEKSVVREVVHNTVEKPSIYTTGDNSSPVLERVEKGMGVITGLMGRDGRKGQDESVPGKAPKQPENGHDFPPPPDPGPKAPRSTAAAQTPLQVTVAKLADQIIVREDADIDRIGEAVAKRVVQAARNMAPA